jgi:hypothetical protein
LCYTPNSCQQELFLVASVSSSAAATSTASSTPAARLALAGGRTLRNIAWRVIDPATATSATLGLTLESAAGGSEVLSASATTVIVVRSILIVVIVIAPLANLIVSARRIDLGSAGAGVFRSVIATATESVWIASQRIAARRISASGWIATSSRVPAVRRIATAIETSAAVVAVRPGIAARLVVAPNTIAAVSIAP